MAFIQLIQHLRGKLPITRLRRMSASHEDLKRRSGHSAPKGGASLAERLETRVSTSPVVLKLDAAIAPSRPGLSVFRGNGGVTAELCKRSFFPVNFVSALHEKNQMLNLRAYRLTKLQPVSTLTRMPLQDHFSHLSLPFSP
jgi:hypothetical protein